MKQQNSFSNGRKGILPLAIALFLTLAGQARPKTDTLTNRTVIQLSGARMGADLIKAKIQNSYCIFDLSTDELIKLKSSGVPDEVITAMLGKTNSGGTPDKMSLQPGIYYLDSPSNTPVELEPSVMASSKSGGFGESMKRTLVSGLINAKLRASVGGSAAQVKVSGNPVFIFAFDTTQKGLNNLDNRWGANVQSPKEFFLVRMKQMNDSREVVVGKYNNVSSSTGVSDELKIDFKYQKMQRGVYRVTLDEPLEDGEYCFMFSSSSFDAAGSKVFDFSRQGGGDHK